MRNISITLAILGTCIIALSILVAIKSYFEGDYILSTRLMFSLFISIPYTLTAWYTAQNID